MTDDKKNNRKEPSEIGGRIAGTLFRPAVTVMDRLSYPRKMLLMAFVVAIPLALFMALFMTETNEDLSTAGRQTLGIEYTGTLMRFLLNVQQHRALAKAHLSGDGTLGEQIADKQRVIEREISFLDAFDRTVGAKLGTGEEWTRVRTGWMDLIADFPSMNEKQSFDSHTELIRSTLSLAVHIGDISGLTTDRHIDTVYLVDAALHELPQALEYAGQIRGIGTGALVPKRLTIHERAQLTILTGLSASSLEEVKGNLEKAYRVRPDLRNRVDGPFRETEGKFRRAGEILDRDILLARTLTIGSADFYNVFTDAINAGFILHEALLDAVSTLLKERQARLALRRNAIALFALLSLCVPLYLFIGNYLSVRKALSTLVEASDRIGKGDLAIDVSVDSKDEMTFVAASFNEMARNLARYTEDLKAANSALRDEIGERVKAEEKLEKAVAELKRSNTDLENFAYVASHDLKEPLLVMAMDLKLIERQLRGQVDAESKDLIADTLQRANQMQTLISELLAFSRVGTQAKPFRQTACDEVLDRVLANIKVSVEQSRAVITRDALPAVRADDVQLAQLFQNLVANAIKFVGDEPPRVHISAARGDGEWTFSVRDNGIGIPSDQVEHIFDIFHRAHKDKYPGTGIGLATCKKIVERHGGRIWAEPGPDRGTVFYFTIPDRKEADSEGE